MKKNDNYPKYVLAMRLMDEGKTAEYAARQVKTASSLIKALRVKYLLGGELAMLKPSYQPQLSQEKKLEIIKEVEKKGLSLYRAAIEYGISERTLTRWYKSYVQYGEDGLARKNRADTMKRKRQRTEAELDELEVLRKRNAYLEAENALLKKVKALVEEREARLRAIGQKPSKN